MHGFDYSISLTRSAAVSAVIRMPAAKGANGAEAETPPTRRRPEKHRAPNRRKDERWIRCRRAQPARSNKIGRVTGANKGRTNMKECVAMLLAGGQGSRLYALTRKLAKPAVPFGGKYRIIDFPLSNCVNSGIDTVGVLTQYQPLVLNEYIGNGQPWDLDRIHGGVHVLPPYQTSQRCRLVQGHGQRHLSEHQLHRTRTTPTTC